MVRGDRRRIVRVRDMRDRREAEANDNGKQCSSQPSRRCSGPIEDAHVYRLAGIAERVKQGNDDRSTGRRERDGVHSVAKDGKSTAAAGFRR